MTGRITLKGSLRNVDSKPKGVHVYLATKSMEESTHLDTEVMKGGMVKKIYGYKIILAPIMEREQFSQTKEKIRRC